MNPILADIYSTIIPSAPYLIAAYALIWLVLLVYVVFVVFSAGFSVVCLGGLGFSASSAHLRS